MNETADRNVSSGLGMGGFFALAGTNSINDVFFVHKRGLRVGLWNFAVLASVNLTPVISGYVISNLSWRWIFWLEVILCCILLVAVILFFPETSFNRDSFESSQATETTASTDKTKGCNLTVKSLPADSSRLHLQSLITFILGDSSWRPPAQPNLLFACVKPFTILLHPMVLWGCVMWAVVFTC